MNESTAMIGGAASNQINGRNRKAIRVGNFKTHIMKLKLFAVATVATTLVLGTMSFKKSDKGSNKDDGNCHYYVEWYYSHQTYRLRSEGEYWRRVDIPCVSNIIRVSSTQQAINGYDNSGRWRRDPERATIEDIRNELLEIRKERIEEWQNVQKRRDLAVTNTASYNNISLQNRCQP